MNFFQRMRGVWSDLSRFPWRNTAHTLRERFHEDQLALTASSLTFTSTLALVPFFTVALAVFTAFPMFSTVQELLQKWLVASLVPDNIARQVLGYLTQFAGKASRLGTVGLALTLFTALALILTIDRTLNGIWRVKRPRPLAQRVLIYWAALTLGPVVLGMSLAATSVAVSASRGVIGTLPGGVRFLFDVIEFFLLAGGMTLLYRFVPNTPVRWSHAWAGGLFVAIGIEVGKRLLAFYIGKIPTYSMVYGAFATLPILLIWIYVAWVIVLLGAVIAAYLPSLRSGVARRAGANGWPFQLALEALQELHLERAQPTHGLTGTQLAQRIGVAPLQLEPVMDALLSLDWVGRLASDDEHVPADLQTGAVTVHDEPRFVLLAQPANTPMAPLMERLLLDRVPATEVLWNDSRWAALRLSDVLSANARA